MSDSTPTTQELRDYIDDTQKDLTNALRKLVDVCNAEELHVLNKSLKRFAKCLKLAEVDDGNRGGVMSDVSMPIESVADLNYRVGFAFGKEEVIREAGAKLFEMRQLVIDAHKCKVHDSCCEDCYADTGECPVEHRMRELGIEVGV